MWSVLRSSPAPQVIRKIRGETFADGSGLLKLWCQFFNVLSDSSIKWYKNEQEIDQVKKSKGLADSGNWGNKFFGRIMMTESCIGYGCSRKAWRAKVIYGLEPVFESGNTCIIKVRSPIIYGGKEESSLIERNLHMMKQVF
ncbi:hypothetical protein GOODEAATRI_007030 [Goodea atripinnis]|uniref:Ig-like domain-containing protein n=1 Tax=Goodea atripinnis TaxID=208336 RepID=A0ABV0MPX4_9TELE